MVFVEHTRSKGSTGYRISSDMILLAENKEFRLSLNSVYGRKTNYKYLGLSLFFRDISKEDNISMQETLESLILFTLSKVDISQDIYNFNKDFISYLKDRHKKSLLNTDTKEDKYFGFTDSFTDEETIKYIAMLEASYQENKQDTLSEKDVPILDELFDIKIKKFKERNKKEIDIKEENVLLKKKLEELEHEIKMMAQKEKEKARIELSTLPFISNDKSKKDKEICMEIVATPLGKSILSKT